MGKIFASHLANDLLACYRVQKIRGKKTRSRLKANFYLRLCFIALIKIWQEGWALSWSKPSFLKQHWSSLLSLLEDKWSMQRWGGRVIFHISLFIGSLPLFIFSFDIRQGQVTNRFLLLCLLACRKAIIQFLRV